MMTCFNAVGVRSVTCTSSTAPRAAMPRRDGAEGDAGLICLFSHVRNSALGALQSPAAERANAASPSRLRTRHRNLLTCCYRHRRCRSGRPFVRADGRIPVKSGSPISGAWQTDWDLVIDLRFSGRGVRGSLSRLPPANPPRLADAAPFASPAWVSQYRLRRRRPAHSREPRQAGPPISR